MQLISSLENAKRPQKLSPPSIELLGFADKGTTLTPNKLIEAECVIGANFNDGS
jgi:hypothetical protein